MALLLPPKENTRKKHSGSSLMALAAGSLSFAKVHAHDVETLEQTEKSLEKEICRENRTPPKGSVAKIRHHGERFLHSKQVLMVVVILNIIDCILVMGELIFDIHYLVDVLEKSENISDSFMYKMETKYPIDLRGIDDISDLYDKIIHSTIHWNTSEVNMKTSYANDKNLTYLTLAGNDSLNIRYKRRTVKDSQKASNTNRRKKRHKEHTIEEDIAHGFHKASITILAILVVETGLKMFCLGAHMLENKLEVFDGFIVFASFILDIAFIKGITIYSIQEFVFILAFLVPWRVLRVVNSLIVAIIDHEHFRMKLLYKQKKQISIQMKDAKKELKLYEKSLQSVEQLCLCSGIPEYKVKSCSAHLKSRKKKLIGSCGSLQRIVTFEAEERTPMVKDYESKDDNSDTFKMDSSRANSLDDVYNP
ncbi:uncharacterized protein LOC143081694 isoform X1 [Mytilus galloprovincialis]|uniref:uncharacterized protein LOC143081694 isoform X1 n=1 Tax=Mytilus galloprovincialis TaxID=29158 RepID=UPI003F7C64A5